MSTLCSHCDSPSDLHCSCGEFICSASLPTHFLQGHHSVPLRLHMARLDTDTETVTIAEICTECRAQKCEFLCLCQYPWLSFCGKCGEKHLATGLKRHSLEPIAAAQLLRRKTDKFPYMQRQLLLDEIAHCLQDNLSNIVTVKEAFLSQYQALIASLESWKEACLAQFDAIHVEEDVKWALERLESQRFLREFPIECGLDAVLKCDRIEEVSDLLQGAIYEFQPDFLLSTLPGSFKVTSRLPLLRQPASLLTPQALSILTVPLKAIHSAEIDQNLKEIRENLEGTMRLLWPQFCASTELEEKALTEEMQGKAQGALAEALSGKVLEEVGKVMRTTKSYMDDIMREIGADIQENESFLTYLDRFKTASIDAVSNLNGISQALKSAVSLNELTLSRDFALTQVSQVQQQLSALQLEHSQLCSQLESLASLRCENDGLKAATHKLQEELRTVRLSLSAGLEESVRTIVESAKGRIGKSELAAKGTIEEAIKEKEDWEMSFRKKLEEEKMAIRAIWTPLTDFSEANLTCDSLKQGNDSIVDKTNETLRSVRESLAKGFRRYQEEMITLWEEHSKKYLSLFAAHQEVLGKVSDLPSFQMFLGTVVSEVVEQRQVLELGAMELDQLAAGLQVGKETLKNMLARLQTRQVKKREKLAVYEGMKETLAQQEQQISKLKSKKEEIWRNLSSSLLAFQEASKDTNFQRLDEFQRTMEQKYTEFAKASQTLSQVSGNMRTALESSGSYFLSSIQAQYDSVPTTLAEHRTAFLGWVDSTVGPVVHCLAQTQDQCIHCIDSVTSVVTSELEIGQQRLFKRKAALEAEYEALRKPYPEDIPVKPVLLSEAVTTLVDDNERLHDEVSGLTRALTNTEVTLQGKALRIAADLVEKRLETTLGAVLAQWLGKASHDFEAIEVSTTESFPDLSFPGLQPHSESEPEEVMQALLAEAAEERQTSRLSTLLPDHFTAVPMSATQAWQWLESRLQELFLCSVSELTSSDLLFSGIQEGQTRRIVACWVLLARRGNAKSQFLLRLLGLETQARATPRDFALVVKYMRSFRTLADQYLKSSNKPWKKSQAYQLSKWGEAWLDDVLSKYVNSLSGEAWLVFLQYCKPASVSTLQYLFFLVNWKVCTQHMRREEVSFWPDQSVSVLPVSDFATLLTPYLDSWLPNSLIQALLAELSPMGYVDKSTVEAYLGLSAYMSVSKDDRFIVRGDMFLLGILEANFTIAKTNCRKIAEIYLNSQIREGSFTRAAFDSSLRLISQGDRPREDLYEETLKQGGGLHAFLRVMMRHRLELVGQMMGF